MKSFLLLLVPLALVVPPPALGSPATRGGAATASNGAPVFLNSNGNGNGNNGNSNGNSNGNGNGNSNGNSDDGGDDGDDGFSDEADAALAVYSEYEDAITWYLRRCSEMLDDGVQCCGYDELVALYSRKIDSRCLLPWGKDALGCAGGFFAPLSDLAKSRHEVGFNATRTDDHRPVPAGFFGPVSFLCIVPCSPGAWCPPGELREFHRPEDTQDVSAACQAGNGTECCWPYGSPLYLGQCGGADRDNPCEAGQYCETPTESSDCPGGYFCRAGSVEPQRCPPLTKCGPRTSSPASNFMAAVVIGGIVVLGTIAYFLIRNWTSIRAVIVWFPLGEKILSCGGDGTEGGGADGADGDQGNVPLLECDGRGGYNADGSNGDGGGDGGGAQDPEVGIAPGVAIAEKPYKVEISFEGLGLRLRGGNRKSVLRGVTGSVRPFRVTAIMGPSGAGKTTFLSTLCGKATYGVTSGKLMVNGDPTVPLIPNFRREMGFVPQEDVMHRSLTCREILRAQADLRLPAGYDTQTREEIVTTTIELLELSHVADSPIGDEETRGVSGGQRKRVNIGMELVAEPTLLFLDEPTSGLDSTSSFSVIRALRRVAEAGGLTVAAVLHQPRFEIFTLFHDVLLLGPGGRTVYLGPSTLAKGYFEHLGYVVPDQMNPADFFMDAIAGLYHPVGKSHFGTEELMKAWETKGRDYIDTAVASASASASANANANGNADKGKKRKENGRYIPRVPRGPFFQAWVFFQRSILLQRRHAREIVLDLILVLVAGTFLGAVYPNVKLGQVMSLMTMSSLALGLLGMISSLRYFGDDKPVAWREASSGVNRMSFLAGVMASHVPLIVLTPLLYISMLYTFTAPRTSLDDYYNVALAGFWCASGIGYLISLACSPRTSQMACVVVALISSMLSGANPTLKTLDNIKVIGPMAYSCSYARWFSEAMFEREASRYSQVWLPQVTGYADHFGFSGDNFSHCVGVLWAMGFVARGLAAASMVLFNREKVA